jgi:hypothetical protein
MLSGPYRVQFGGTLYIFKIFIGIQKHLSSLPICDNTLKSIISQLQLYMGENEERRAEGEASKNYYSGYYWGNEPYSSAQMPGRKSDEELRNDVITNLSALGLSHVNVSVKNSIATLTGTVRNYEQRRKAGAEAWRTQGISEVLNELYVTDPETAGPSRS